MSDSQKAFVFLKENISTWLAELDDVDARIVETLKTSATESPAYSRPSKSLKRSNSTESLRPTNPARSPDDVAVFSLPVDTTVTTQPTTVSKDPATSPFSREGPLAFPPIQGRKRKTASLYSNPTDGKHERLKHSRPRNITVVWYDSRIQKAFEQLVRNISSGRNMLRKGKMAAKLEALAAEVTVEEDDSEDDLEREVLMLGGKIDGPNRQRLPPSFSRTRLGPPAIVMGEGDASARFDETDKLLEVAQSMCEKAAHQFLREGDCRDDTAQARQKLQAAMQRSLREVELQEERDRLNSAKRKPMDVFNGPRPKADAMQGFTFTGKPLLPGESRFSLSADDGLGAPIPLLVDADDSDGETMPALPPIRYTRMTRAQ